MHESYIQYAAGYQKDNIDEADITKAVKDIQEMDAEHGAFWVSVITDHENVVEVNKDLSLSIILDGEEVKYKAQDWESVEQLYSLMIHERFEEIKERIK